MKTRLSKKGRLFIRLCEKVAFTVLTGTGALIAFFSGHPIVAFAMTIWSVVEAKGAFKAWWAYSEEPIVTVVASDAIEIIDDVKQEETK